MSSTRPPATRQRQQGAATLIVVMVLFFIITMVAAYTNRNLIFEQRTSVNQYRSTQALEAAEAGLEWAISMLNVGRITSTCAPSTNTGDKSFRQRYLGIDTSAGSTSGHITPIPDTGGGDLTPSCVSDLSGGWTCSCPETGAPTLSAPTGPGIAPAFRVRFRPTAPPRPGVVWAQVVGCTRLDASTGPQCLTFDGQGAASEGRAVVSTMLALASAPAVTPQAALTARDAISAVGPIVYNSSGIGSGITVHSGGTVAIPDANLHGAPGSPAAASKVTGDTTLSLPALAPFSATDRTFASVFNLRPETFRTQQAVKEITCPCTAATVNAEVALNPGRPLWLNGDLGVEADIGTAASPVLLVVNGDLQFTTSGAIINGLVYARLAGTATDWTTGGAGGQIKGAVMAEGGVAGTGTPTVVYDADVLRVLRNTTGSFVRVPGSWRDFQ